MIIRMAFESVSKVMAAAVVLFIANSSRAEITGLIVDENSERLGGTTNIIVRIRGESGARSFRGRDGAYSLPIDNGTVLTSILFLHRGRHPGLVHNISSQFDGNINKVLFPRVGPVGYERNIDQLLAYERLFYIWSAEGLRIPDGYRELILQMPDPDGCRERDQNLRDELTHAQHLLLRRKRHEVLQLFGLHTGRRCHR